MVKHLAFGFGSVLYEVPSTIIAIIETRLRCVVLICPTVHSLAGHDCVWISFQMSSGSCYGKMFGFGSVLYEVLRGTE